MRSSDHLHRHRHSVVVKANRNRNGRKSQTIYEPRPATKLIEHFGIERRRRRITCRCFRRLNWHNRQNQEIGLAEDLLKERGRKLLARAKTCGQILIVDLETLRQPLFESRIERGVLNKVAM